MVQLYIRINVSCFFLGIYRYIYIQLCTCGAHTHTYIYNVVMYMFVLLCIFICMSYVRCAFLTVCPRHSGEGTAARQDTNRSNWDGKNPQDQWIGGGFSSTGNHEETIEFPMKYVVFCCKWSLKPIQLRIQIWNITIF